MLKLPGDTFTFIYDLGDDWKHIVKLTDIMPNREDHTDGDDAGAHLISGQGACPPEDVECECYLKWLGREFDLEFFNLHELQNRVDDFQRVIGEARWGFYHR